MTYFPDKKPFVYYEEKDGKQVPLDLESPEAPHWNDNNEEFWKKAEEFVSDQPEVPIPYRFMVSSTCSVVSGSKFQDERLLKADLRKSHCPGIES